MTLQEKLLASVRTTVVSMAKNQKAEVDSIEKEHLATIDELATWPAEKFEEKWNEFILASGAGPYAFLSQILKKDKKEEELKSQKEKAETEKK